MNDDTELLRRYVEEGADEAFTELVQRHVNFVYSAASRQLHGDAHLAADATQSVFADLVRKAPSLIRHRVLAGWLFTSVRFATAKLVRGERRRHARETEALLMQELIQDDPAVQFDWERVRPVLDDVLAELRDDDREAILLRFFEGRDFAGVGAKLGLADNAARMRVERALEKLRLRLERRGVTSTNAALGLALANQGVLAAPAGLAAAVAGSALAGGAAFSGIAGAGTAGAGGAAAIMNFMSMTKLQLGLTSALAVAGASGLMLEANTSANLRREAVRLAAENSAIPLLQSENLKLGRLAVEVEEMRRDDAEFVRLQGEAQQLKTRMHELARAEAARQPRAAKSGQVYEISDLDQTPVARFQARPQYPFEMRRAGVSGEVVVDFLVDTNGEVQDAYALRSSQKEFEAAAVQAVSKWKFRPGRKGGRDVPTHLQVPIVFSLEGQTKARPPTQPSAGAGPTVERAEPSTTVNLATFDVVGTSGAASQAAAPRE